MNDSLESTKDLLSFFLGTWKVSRERRAGGKPFASLFADLTLLGLLDTSQGLSS